MFLLRQQGQLLTPSNTNSKNKYLSTLPSRPRHAGSQLAILNIHAREPPVLSPAIAASAARRQTQNTEMAVLPVRRRGSADRAGDLLEGGGAGGVVEGYEAGVEVYGVGDVVPDT